VEITSVIDFHPERLPPRGLSEEVNTASRALVLFSQGFQWRHLGKVGIASDLRLAEAGRENKKANWDFSRLV